MRIALGSDHRGAEAIRALVEHLRGRGHEALVLGPCTPDREVASCDYPDAAYAVAHAVADGDVERGILVCGSGIGVSIAANKVDGVRAALAFDVEAAEMTRRHNDANVLCISGDRATTDEVIAMADAFLAAPFEGGRHGRRVAKIAAIERGEDPAAQPARETPRC